MKTAVITDAKYRTVIAAARTLGRAGYKIILTQTRDDCHLTPPAFDSRYVIEKRWIPGSVSDRLYANRLYDILREYPRPVLLCVGAVSQNMLSWQRERFSKICDFLIAPPNALDMLNDKAVVYRRCLDLNLPVPKQYNNGKPDSYPVIIKPRCGERFGLKAKDRYKIARNDHEFSAAVSAMSRWDPEPLIQEKLIGDGEGACLLLNRNSELIDFICHRRIREYPVTGGPSSCCESIYRPDLISQAYTLLKSFQFQGLAMVEFKAGKILEVNPRIWGSFPLTEKAGSPIAIRYALASAGEYNPDYSDKSPDNYLNISYSRGSPVDLKPAYGNGVRMRFLLNDTAAMLDLLRHGRFRDFLSAIPDCFSAQEALSSHDDPGPMRRYLRNIFLRR